MQGRISSRPSASGWNARHKVPGLPAHLCTRSRQCFSSPLKAVSQKYGPQQIQQVRVPEFAQQPEHQQAQTSSTSDASDEPTSNPIEELSDWIEQYQLPDEMSLWDDDGSYHSSRRDLQFAYMPPKSDLPGFAAAAGLITAWACLFRHAIWGFDLGAEPTLPHLLDGILTFMSLEFVSTGLFITTHDSMHGSVTPNNRFLNDVLGATCVTLYAWFDYSLMWTKHWEHHNLCGQPHEDPDFHKGNPDLVPWFLSFMKGYVSWQQIAKLVVTTTALAVFAHAPYLNMTLFWAGSGALSAMRLFYFGTYIPHKPRQGADEVMAWAKARSARAPTPLSFLRCYCFNMHWEHHRWPFAPWWDLPRARAIRYQAMGSLDD